MALELEQIEQPKKDLVPLASAPQKDTDSSAFDSGARMQVKAQGTSGTEIYAGYFSEEYLTQLRGRAGAKIYDEMRRSESQVSMLLNAVMNPIKAAVWEFEAAKDVPNAEVHKAFLEFNSKEAIDWETHVHEALTMLVHGFSLFEVVHSVVFNHPKFGTFNGLKALAFRNQKTIERWNVDRATGSLKTVEQWVNGDLATQYSAQITMLADFLLVFTLQKEGDNYEGISALRPMYGPWFRKNLYLKLAAIGIEKNAIGTPMGTIPKGKEKDDEVANFKEVLSNFTSHELAYITKPEGWEIEILKNDFDAAAVKEMVLLENTEMINSLVANFLALGMNGGGGAYALGSDLSDFFLTGIQNYADLIAGVWNRKLIPDLIKLNFGPQMAYPKLKAAGINDKAGKELAEIISSLIGSQAIKADMKLEEFLRKQYKLPVPDPTTVREKPAPAPYAPSGAQFSENRIQLAEGYKKKFNENKSRLKEEMQKGLAELLENYRKQIRAKWKGTTPAQRITLATKLEPKGLANYKQALKEIMAEIAWDGLQQAKKETPWLKKKLSESFQLEAPRGGFFEALPPNIKKIVKAKFELIGETQAADLGKIVALQFSSSANSTEDVEQIISDIDAATLPVLEGSTAGGMSIDAAAGNAVASIVNEARMDWFFDEEVYETIESFTFVNEDPVSEVCQELDGMTWPANDPDLDRYAPPLHHNCKSRIVPNEKGAKGNPEIKRGGTAITQKALDSITLCECDFHIKFELKEPK